MQIHISSHDGLPIYLQILNQVKYLIASGRLGPGEQLPPVRRLAEQLVVNPNTVARAYRELETAGLIMTRRGAGVYVAEGGSPLTRAEQRRILAERIDLVLAEARQMDFEMEELVKLLKQRSEMMK
ncbi:MAG: GntR family transcriptional regulator [Candidatus Sumerlaeia bacterium]